MFSRRALLSAFPTLALLPEEPTERRLSTLRRKPEKEDKPDACPPVFPLAVTQTMHDVKQGEDVMHRCGGEDLKVGSAFEDAEAGHYLLVVLTVDVGSGRG